MPRYNQDQHDLANTLQSLNVGQWVDIQSVMIRRVTEHTWLVNEERMGFMDAFDALKEHFA
jgi:hypothetical protein